MCRWRSLSSIALVVLLCGAAARPAQVGAAGPESAERAKTTITAEKMTVRNQESKAIFEGKVVLTKGALTVHSDVMVISFRPSDQPAPAGGTAGQTASRSIATGPTDKPVRPGSDELPVVSNRSVSLIEATGRVRIKKADGRATCGKAIYYGDEDKIELTGNPVAWEQGTRVTGKKITMYLAENRSVVEGGSRVMIDENGRGIR